MPDIKEGRLTFRFPASWQAMKYDETHFYRKHFQHCAASKCVDLVAFNTDTNEPLWLIEIKDYRAQRRTKTQDLCDELAQKVRDTLANLFLVQRKEGADCYAFAVAAAQRRQIRFVLHLEQPHKPSRLYPLVAERAKFHFKLRQKLRAVDAHPLFYEIASMPADWHWRVISQ